MRRSLLLAALLAWGQHSARAETTTAQALEVPAAPSPRGGPVELAIFGGAGGPVGPAGVSVAYLPFSRLSLGLALGHVSLQDEVDYGRREGPSAFRLEPFLRGYVVDRPAWRLGLGLGTTHGTEITHHSGTADDGTPAVIFWHRDNANRVDASVLLELVLDNLALRVEAGLGRVYGSSFCAVRFGGVNVSCQEQGLGQTRPEPEVTQSPSSWRPSLQLAVAVRPGGAAGPDPAQRPETPTGGGHWRVSLAATNVRSTDLLDSEEFDDGTRFDAGVEAEYLRQPSAGGLRWGAGARYSYGAGTDFAGSEHVAFVPALLGWAWRSGATGEEIEILGGLGPGLMALQESRDYRLWALAAGVELAVNYIRPLPVAGHWALVVGVGARVLALIGIGAFHAELPVHVGLRF